MAAGGRARGVLFLIASILGAAGVTFIVFNMVQNIRSLAAPQARDEKIEVVVAAVDIPPGWNITPEMLQTRTMSAQYVQEALKTADSVVGRVAMERILFGEFIREDRLAPPEAGSGMAAIIPRGMRAFQVDVGGGQGMSGFLSPGNFVDVIAVCDEVEPPEVRTILRSVTVLAINDKMVDDDYVNPSEPAPTGKRKKKGVKAKPSVTLAMTPDDTVLLKHATQECEIYLSLRNDIDVTLIENNDYDGASPTGAAGAPTALPGIEVQIGAPMDPQGAAGGAAAGGVVPGAPQGAATAGDSAPAPAPSAPPASTGSPGTNPPTAPTP